MTQLFKYEEPLHPDKDRNILVKRQNQVNEIINEILRGKFWAIYGPRKIGKTTLLNQIRDELAGNYCCIYVDCRNSPNDPQRFFQWFIEEVEKELKVNNFELIEKDQHSTDAPYENLAHIIVNLSKTTEESNPKLIFLIDEIEQVPALEDFLGCWRRIHEARHNNAKYNIVQSVVVTGSTNLIKLSVGESSPYNIAKQIHLKDFSKEDFLDLCNRIFVKEKQVLFTERDKSYLYNQLGGHPQMVQHALSELAKSQKANPKLIKRLDVKKALDSVKEQNTCLKILKHQVRNDNQLQELIIDISKGKKVPFYLYDEYELKGTGIIKKSKAGTCEFRNEIFKKYLDNLKIVKSLYLQIVEDLMRSTVTAENFEDLSQTIVKRCAEFLNSELCTLWKIEKVKDENKLMLVEGVGLPEEPIRLDPSYQVYFNETNANAITGIAPFAVLKNVPVCINSYDELINHANFDEEFFNKIWGEPKRGTFKSLLILPLRLDDEPLGVIRWENIDNPTGFSEDDVKLAKKLAPFIAIVLKSMKYRNDRIGIRQRHLKELAESFFKSKDPKELNQQIVIKIAELLNADICSMWLYSSANNSLRLSAAEGINFPFDKAPVYSITLSPEESEDIDGLTAWVAIHKKPIYVEDFYELKNHPAWKGKWDKIQWGDKPEKQFVSLYGVPLLGEEGKLVGVLKIERKKDKNPFSDLDRSVLDLMAVVISLGLTLISQRREDLMFDFFHLLKQPASNATMVCIELEKEFKRKEGPRMERIETRLGQLARNLQTMRAWSGNVYSMVTGNAFGQNGNRWESPLYNTISFVIQNFRDSFPDFTFNIDSNLSNYRLLLSELEERKFKVVMDNILFNSIKYSERYSCADISTSLSPNGDLEIRVKDYGQGIAPEDLPYIFNPYFSRGADKWPESLGMGLATVERVLNDFCWKKKVISELHKGTEFIIFVPKDTWRYNEPEKQ